MSQKWRRAKQWDDEHLTGGLRPVKWVLRTFSSITLAIITLTGIAVYGTLASVPIGLLAEIPTWAIYIATLLAAIAAGVLLPVSLSLKLLRRLGVGPAWRYAVGLLGSLGLIVGVVVLWLNLLWPHLRWNAATGEGLMLFAGFVESHRSTTLRRLPGFEMSELEFYGWWPMKALLLLLIVNLVIATVRRIEFIFANIGVLTVHTGIVVLGIGSALYSNLKLEGDTVLFAGQPDESGQPALGPPETGFYDNTDVALWVAQLGRGGAWQQRPLTGVPRYNDYGLDAAWPAGASVPDGVDLGRRGLQMDAEAQQIVAANPDTEYRMGNSGKVRHVLLYDYSCKTHSKTHILNSLTRLANQYGFRLDRGQTANYITPATLQGVDVVVLSNGDCDVLENSVSLNAVRNFVEVQGKGILHSHAAAAGIPCPDEKNLADPACRWQLKTLTTQFLEHYPNPTYVRIYADSVKKGEVPPRATGANAAPSAENHGRSNPETRMIFESRLFPLPANGTSGVAAGQKNVWDGLGCEWYAYRSNPRLRGQQSFNSVPFGAVNILLSLDESSVTTSTCCRMGDRPASWTRKVGKGNAAYQNAGHSDIYRQVRKVGAALAASEPQSRRWPSWSA